MENKIITQNKTKRTYTFTVNGNKYRTTQLTKQEFEEFEYNTSNDLSTYVKSNQVIAL
jgi:hypothetical protein